MHVTCLQRDHHKTDIVEPKYRRKTLVFSRPQLRNLVVRLSIQTMKLPYYALPVLTAVTPSQSVRTETSTIVYTNVINGTTFIDHHIQRTALVGFTSTVTHYVTASTSQNFNPATVDLAESRVSGQSSAISTSRPTAIAGHGEEL